MDNDLTQLERMLDQLTARHAELADLVEQQRAAMQRADAAMLEQLGWQIETLIVRIAELEVQRRDLCISLADRMGISFDDPTGPRMTQLTARVPGTRRRRLAESAARLREQMQRVKRGEQVNQRLAGKVRDFFSDLLTDIGRVARQTGCYDGKGRRTSAAVAPSCFSAVG